MPTEDRKNLRWDLGAGGLAVILLLAVLGWRTLEPPPRPPAKAPAEAPAKAIAVEIIRPEPPPEPAPKAQAEPKPPSPKPPPPPEPAREPPPEPPPAPAAAPTTAAADPGAMPPLVANYRQHVGFRRYAEGMAAAGAAFYIVGGQPRRFLRLDLANGRLVPTPVESIRAAGYSPRTRAITDEPALAPWLDRARAQHGVEAGAVVMLVPQVIEQRLATAIDRAVRAAGLQPGQVVAIRGEYRLEAGRLALHLRQARQAWDSHPIHGELPL